MALRRRPRTWPAALLVAALGCGTSIPEPDTTRISDDSLPVPVQEILTPLLAEYPGIAYAIGRHGDVVHAGGLGWADVESREPVEAGTRFRLYSVIKPVTAASALVLAERGALALDRPVSTWLDGLHGPIASATPRMLIGHLAGIRDYRDGEWMEVSRKHCRSAADALEFFASDPLASPPGERYAYTTFGYVLLSAAIESATRRPLDAVLRETVLEPSGATGIEAEEASPAKAHATPYEAAHFGRVRPARAVDNSCRAGAGGYVGSAPDLVRFALGFAGGSFLGAEERDLALSSMRTSAGDTTGYGFGWGVERDAAGRRMAIHSGSGIGGRSAIVLLPDEGIAVAILGNLEGESLVDEARAIAEIVVEGERARARGARSPRVSAEGQGTPAKRPTKAAVIVG